MNVMGLPQVKSLLIIASQLSGYPIPADALPPPVEIVTTEEMTKAVCADIPLTQILGCGVIGYFQFPTLLDGNDGKEHIKVISDDDDHSINAIAVHELTHWLQWHNWKNPESRECPREFNREYEAYFVGFRYEVIYEHKAPPEKVNLPGLSCPFVT